MCGTRKSSLKRLSNALIVSFLCVVIGFGCRGKNIEIPSEITSSAENLYRQGERYIKKDPERARLYFRQVIESFPKNFYAQQAKLAIADSYFQKGDEANMILASAEYREFRILFPFSPSAPYAQYQIGMTFYKKILGPGRDQTKTEQALEEFKKVLTTYPTSEEAKAAQEKIQDCEDRLASHIYQIGRHYYKIGSFSASVNRLRGILIGFPNFPDMDKVYYYMGDSFYRGKNFPQALSHFTKLISDYPQSKFAKKAKKKLDELEKLRKAAEKKAPIKKDVNH
jgi:outer membrane protein assembly factor BamD